MTIYLYVRKLDGLQTRLINDKGEKTMSYKVKTRKFVNTLLGYIQEKIIPHMATSKIIYEQIFKEAESHESVKKKLLNHSGKSKDKKQG